MRRTSLDTSLDMLMKPQTQSLAHSAGTMRHHNKSKMFNYSELIVCTLCNRTDSVKSTE